MVKLLNVHSLTTKQYNNIAIREISVKNKICVSPKFITT